MKIPAQPVQPLDKNFPAAAVNIVQIFREFVGMFEAFRCGALDGFEGAAVRIVLDGAERSTLRTISSSW